MIKFEDLKNTHWLIASLVSIYLFFKKIVTRRLNKAEKEILQKIKNQPDQKIVFIKMDNTEPISKKNTGIEYNNQYLISLLKKMYLKKDETRENIIYSILE